MNTKLLHKINAEIQTWCLAGAFISYACSFMVTLVRGFKFLFILDPETQTAFINSFCFTAFLVCCFLGMLWNYTELEVIEPNESKE